MPNDENIKLKNSVPVIIAKDLTPDHYQAIGRITTEMAAVEQALKVITSRFINPNDVMFGLLIFHDYQFARILKIFKQLILHYFRETEIASLCESLVSNLTSLSSKRNDYIHSAYLFNPEINQMVKASIVNKDKTIDVKFEPMENISVKELNELADKIIQEFNNLINLQNKIWSTVNEKSSLP